MVAQQNIAVVAPPVYVGHKGKLEWLRAGNVMVDREYQRYLNKKKVDAMVRNFDPDLMGVLLGSRRSDGFVYDLDGQHRLEAVLQLYGPDAFLPFFVMEGLNDQQEASIFWKSNKWRLNAASADTFRARIKANEEIAMKIKQVTEDLGINIQLYPQPLGPNDVMAFSALEAMYHDGTLEPVLRVLRSAWPKEPGALKATNLAGMQAFFHQFYREFFADKKYGEARLHRLIEILGLETPRDIERRAAMYQEGLHSRKSTSVARSIYWHYSRRLKTSRLKLSSWGVDEDPAAKLVEIDDDDGDNGVD